MAEHEQQEQKEQNTGASAALSHVDASAEQDVKVKAETHEPTKDVQGQTHGTRQDVQGQTHDPPQSASQQSSTTSSLQTNTQQTAPHQTQYNATPQTTQTTPSQPQYSATPQTTQQHAQQQQQYPGPQQHHIQQQPALSQPQHQPTPSQPQHQPTPSQPQPQYEQSLHQSNGAPPGYAPAQQIPPPHHNPYAYSTPSQQYTQQPVNSDTNAFSSQMRYSMPLPVHQQLPGARHKKEIKRRTKTGCLTCRKRRIKCDEAHPACRNCQKSKRDCLGYDPIFKAQTGQPANIQPQPNPKRPSESQSPNQSPNQQPIAQPHYSNVPQGYIPASNAGYAPSTATHNHLDQPYEYTTTIDPNLGASQHQHPQHAPPPMPPPQEEYTTILLPERTVRLITMDDVYHLDGIAPSFPNSRDLNVQPLPPHELDAIRDLYLREYAPGLDRFFETDWYGVQGLSVLMSDQEILKYFAHCLDRFRHPHPENNKGCPSIEARLIWVLARMAFMMPPGPQGPLNFLPRIEAVSHIILGTFMPHERVPPAPTTMPDPKMQPDAYAFYLQDLFWHHLSSFTTIHDDDPRQSSTSGQAIANHLAGMRNILSMLENRDVLYSMAIARHFGGRMERYEADKILVGRGPEPEDPLNKLAVALGFLANEEVQGTTQVVQRLCGMNRRGFQLQRLDSAESVGGHDGVSANGSNGAVSSQQPQMQAAVPAAMTK